MKDQQPTPIPGAIPVGGRLFVNWAGDLVPEARRDVIDHEGGRQNERV